jgi:adenine deaminase
VVWDPHEIANVLGVRGIEEMLKFTEDLAVQFYFMLPSCVPSTQLETSGAKVDFKDIQRLLEIYPQRVLGLAEVMNYPGVLLQGEHLMKKIAAANGKVIDGHCPGLQGQDLNAYILAGPGSDHESCFLDEALEKLRKGMQLMVRQGSSAKNLKDLAPVFKNRSAQNISFVTDDLHPDDLLNKGHMDQVLRLAIEQGVDPVKALQAATINSARYFRLPKTGALAPGYRADAILLNNLENFEIDQVFLAGKRYLSEKFSQVERDISFQNLQVKDINQDDFCVKVRSTKSRVKAIEIVPEQIVTRAKICKPRIKNAQALADPSQDLLKLAVIERHKASGDMGLGFVVGLGLKSGAVGSTVAHDSHNLILAGVDDLDMLAASRYLTKTGGGLVVVNKGKVLASLALPLAGLMSYEPIEKVVKNLEGLNIALAGLGCRKKINIFMHLSFLALPVIPELRLTDQGLVDVKEFGFTSLWAD